MIESRLQPMRRPIRKPLAFFERYGDQRRTRLLDQFVDLLECTLEFSP